MLTLEQRLRDEQAILDEIGHQADAEMERIRTKFDEQERQAWQRIWAVQLVLHVAYKPDCDPASLSSSPELQPSRGYIKKRRRA